MSITVNFSPASLDFGVVAPSVTTGKQVRSERLTAAANVSASISGNAAGHFKLSALRSFTETQVTLSPPSSEPGNGPPSGPVRMNSGGSSVTTTNFNQTGVWNGATPLAVPAGEFVFVDVQYIAPAASTGPAATATLHINGDTWNPVSIALTAETADLTIQVSNATVLQGNNISIPFKIVSTAGPATQVTLALGKDSSIPGYLTIDTLNFPPVQVSHGSPASGSFELTAALNTEPGVYTLSLYTTAFGTSATLSFPVTVEQLVLRQSPIAATYARFKSRLGAPVVAESFCSDYVGQYATFTNGAIYWDGVSADAFEIDNVNGPLYALFLGPDNDPATAPQTRFGYPISNVAADNTIPGRAAWSIRCASPTVAPWTLLANAITGAQILQDGAITTAWKANTTLGFPIGQAGTGPTPNGGPDYTIQAFENGIIYMITSVGKAIVPTFAFTATTTPANAFHAQKLLDTLSSLINQAVNKYNSASPPPANTIGMEDGPYFRDAAPVADYVPGGMGPFGTIVGNRKFQVAQKMYARAFCDPDFTMSFDVAISLGGGVGVVNAQGQVVDIHGKPVSDVTGQPITAPAPSSLTVQITNITCTITKTPTLMSDAQKQQLNQESVAAFQEQAAQQLALPSAETSAGPITLSAIGFTTLLNGDIALFVNNPFA